VTNTGKATVSISQAAIIGSGFTMVNGKGATSLPVGQSASLQIQFAPTSEGSDTATLTISSDASNSALGIPLSGTGTEAVIAFSPASLNFNNVPVGQSSSQNVTITNNGNSNLTFSSVAISGSGFTVSGLNPLPTIAGGQSATFSVQFMPTSTAGATASIVFRDDAGNSPQTLTLVGSAVASGSTLAANPGSVNFGNVGDGTDSSLTTSLTNNGNSNITISGVAVTGAGFSASSVPNGTVLTPGQSVTLTVTFAPTTAGAVSGASVTITSNATNSPTTISLSGTGTDWVLLQWVASPTTGVTYNVYRGTSAGGESTTPLNTSPVSATSYTDINVTSGQTYFYIVEAVDSGGNSTASNEVQVTP
jgi:hypothetical protein